MPPATRAFNHIARNLDPGVLVSPQNPVRLLDHSEPQPDLAVFSASYDETRLPTAADIYARIEIVDESIEYDRGTKLPLYAEASIPEEWLFNLVANRIERHTDPGPTGYQTVAFAEPGQRLASLVLPELVFDATYLLGLESGQR
jgi:Uma2 family endonuclease